MTVNLPLRFLGRSCRQTRRIALRASHLPIFGPRHTLPDQRASSSSGRRLPASAVIIQTQGPRRRFSGSPTSLPGLVPACLVSVVKSASRNSVTAEPTHAELRYWPVGVQIRRGERNSERLTLTKYVNRDEQGQGR
jgi:hypothetical protein